MPSIPGTRAYDYWPAIPILRRRSYSKPDNFAGARMRTHRRVASQSSLAAKPLTSLGVRS